MRSERPQVNEEPPTQSLSRYDLILTLIPIALLLTVGITKLVGVSHHTGLLGWFVISAIALTDALFVNPPRPGGRAN